MIHSDQKLFEHAVTSLQAGALDDAERSFVKLLRRYPNHSGALNLLGILLIRQSRYSEAETVIRRAIDADGRSDATFHNYGMVLKALDRPKDAVEAFTMAIALNSAAAETFYNRGTIFVHLKRFQDAIGDFDKVIGLNPHHANAFYQKSLAELELKKPADALASIERALALKSDHAEAWNDRGYILNGMGRFEDALMCYDRALAIQPKLAIAQNNRGNTLQELSRLDEAFASYERALTAMPDYAEAAYNRGLLLLRLKQYGEAIECFKRALALKPDLKFLQGRYLHSKLFVCDWTDFENEFERLLSAVRGGSAAAPPFDILGFPCSASDQLICARTYAAETAAGPDVPLWQWKSRSHDRIRLGYVSGDFHNHATAHLMAELFELHDRSRFEVHAFSFGPDDESGMRARVVKAFDRFHDLRLRGSADIARLILENEVDIAVDLKGYTQNSRPLIFAHRPAPIQASYLGYPGTMGADFIHYVIADAMTAPFDHQPFYTEKIVHLPDTYQVNDRQRVIAELTLTRSEAGLPADAFVYCCFNNNWKITPAMFDVWMRVLRAADGSVLWLLRDNEHVENNLRQEARARTVDPARLVFADHRPLPEHLARHRLADLFLDTLPYNAHTTASDALWAGLPVLTCRGETFAGRVAASVLSAAGLPELVTETLADYEVLALKLARNPALLAEIKAKLAGNRSTCPLFDTARFTRHIEAAYTSMWERHQRGEAPASFAVPPQSP